MKFCYRRVARCGSCMMELPLILVEMLGTTFRPAYVILAIGFVEKDLFSRPQSPIYIWLYLEKLDYATSVPCMEVRNSLRILESVPHPCKTSIFVELGSLHIFSIVQI